MDPITVSPALVNLLGGLVAGGGVIGTLVHLWHTRKSPSPSAPSQPAAGTPDLTARLARLEAVFWKLDELAAKAPPISIPGAPGLSATIAAVEEAAKLLQQAHNQLHGLTGTNQTGAGI